MYIHGINSSPNALYLNIPVKVLSLKPTKPIKGTSYRI
jgi:hypothetical protein